MTSMATQIQDKLISASIESIEAGNDVFLSAPTGAGKSRQFSLIAADQVEKNRKVLVLTERQSLVRQGRRSMERWAKSPITTSEGMNGKIDESGQVVYATIQTVHRLMEKGKIGNYNTVVVDEAHHAKLANHEYVETLDYLDKNNPGLVFVGASATPPPMYGNLYGRLAQADKHVMTFQEAIDARLVDLPETLTPAMRYRDNQNMRGIVDGRRHKRDVAELETGIGRDLGKAREEDWADQLVNVYERHLADRRTLAFFDTIKEATAFMDAAREAGHAPDIMHSKRGFVANEESLDAFRSGRSRLLVSIDMISEGTDVDADGILLDKRTTSADEYKQIIGRESRSHGVERDRKARLVDTGASTYMHGDMGAIANMQTLRGGLERQSVGEADLLPRPDGKTGKYWVEMKTPETGRSVWGTSIDGKVFYATPQGDSYASMLSSKDRNGSRVDLMQIEGQRKGMPSSDALGQWLKDAVRRNEKPLGRLMGREKRGVNELADVVARDWEKNGNSIERTIAMLASGPVVAVQQARSGYSR